MCERDCNGNANRNDCANYANNFGNRDHCAKRDRDGNRNGNAGAD